MDVKTSFLNGDLEEEIYMEQPLRCVVPWQEHKVCKIQKSLYGLKQTPIKWYEKFHQTLISLGYCVNRSNACLYHKVVRSEFVIIRLYVDDMLIFSASLSAICE